GAGPHTASEQYSLCRHSPEVGAVCGKAARTDLGGGRAMKRTFLPLHRREFVARLGSTVAGPITVHAQQRMMPIVGFIAAGERARRAFDFFNRGLAAVGYWRVATLSSKPAGRRAITSGYRAS